MIVYVVSLTSYGFDGDCDSSSTLYVCDTLEHAVILAEDYVKGWCVDVEWNSEKTIGKVNITGKLEIEPFEVMGAR